MVINKSDYFDKYKRLKTFVKIIFTYYILHLVFNKNDNQIIDQYNDPFKWVDEKNFNIWV